MARRRTLLPAMRALARRRAVAPAMQETKGWSGGWTVPAGVSRMYGTEGRADGWDLEKVIADGYERGVWVFKAVETIAGHSSRLPFMVGRGDGPGEIDETMDEHPLYRLLNGQANPLETGRVFRKRLSAQVLLSKRGAFIEVTRSRRGTMTRLDLLPPDRVMPIPDQRGEYISHFELFERDGRTRELDPERVRWVREPHPTDPFSGTTPLEAAGISVDLDHLARLYNVSFLRNDARPGGVLGVDLKGATGRQLDRIEERFAPGVERAGELAVIGMGPGGMSYIDVATRPRDMAYEQLSKISKDEILAAFGTPESMFGNTSGRTYDNAEQDEYTFWTITMSSHNDLIASAFWPDVDDDDGWRPYLDTSGVEALELPQRHRLQVLREEWSAGLISVDEYRAAAGRDPIDNPQTRALWLNPQKAPVPTRPEDAVALGVGGAPGAPPGAPGAGPGGLPPTDAPESGQDGGGAAAQAVAQARGELGDAGGAAAQAVAAARASQQPTAPGAAATAVDAARAAGVTSQAPGAAASAVTAARASQQPTAPGAAAAAVGAARETKSARRDPGWTPDEAAVERLATAAAGALDAILARQTDITVARLRSPKARKGTRYWEPDTSLPGVDTRGGDGPLDAHRAISPERWATEATATLSPLVTAAAERAYADAIRALSGAAAIEGKALRGRGGPAAAVMAALAAVAEAVRTFLNALADDVMAAQGHTDTVDGLAEVVHGRTEAAHDLAEGLARQVAAAVVNGAAQAAAEEVPGIVRTWHTVGDDRVRPAHEALNDETLPVDQPFEIEGASLRYPGDPLAPLHLTINCRCRLYYWPVDGIRPGLEGKSARRSRWNLARHPRDSRGRFIEPGGVARLWGGGLVRVVGALANQRIRVERLEGGGRETHRADRLTMVARPDGTAPTKDAGKLPPTNGPKGG
ncbi:phage portal protein [Actinacidiphila sp. bgisy160]|uniref:phage portal protein n=1 Tax=Actinacidiphila sp. bgisy160 TaxID=3413796 RepID=UPI003D740CBD